MVEPLNRGWKLCRTGATSWTGGYSSTLLEGWADLEERERALGFQPGQPFLLRPDGSCDFGVSAYFASAAFQVLAYDSQISYATDMKIFLSFLERHGTAWREATPETLLDFEYWRRRDETNPSRVGGSKFSRELAAIARFYRWQVARGVVSASPVLTVSTLDRRGESRTRAELQPTNVRSRKVKWLTPRAYRRWRDVGMGGYTAAGLLDEGWRGRNDGRNISMCDLMWNSGLRLREAGTLLTDEMPTVMGSENYLCGRIAEAVAKGRGRDYWVSRKALQRIDGYIMSTRAESVRRAQAAGRYDELRGMQVITDVTKRGVVTLEDERGQLLRVHLDGLDARQRLRLFRRTPHGVEPAAIWLSEAGTPMPYLTWEKVFADANARCGSRGVQIYCHPHMLRHSFALRMLLTAFHQFDRRMDLSEEQRLENRYLFSDPWVLVQTMLGHANLSTTRNCYLEPVQGLQVDMFLNEDDDDDSIQDLLRRIAQTSPRVLDIEEGK
jgi:site-specific recombinase XerD